MEVTGVCKSPLSAWSKDYDKMDMRYSWQLEPALVGIEQKEKAYSVFPELRASSRRLMHYAQPGRCARSFVKVVPTSFTATGCGLHRS